MIFKYAIEVDIKAVLQQVREHRSASVHLSENDPPAPAVRRSILNAARAVGLDLVVEQNGRTLTVRHFGPFLDAVAIRTAMDSTPSW